MIIHKIPGFSRYSISRDGIITSHTFKGRGIKVVKTKLDKDGYQVADITDNDGIRRHTGVHRLVAITFVSNIDNLPQVNHINGIKTDNQVENLEWCTCKQNIHHAWRTGLTKHVEGARHKSSKLVFNTETGIYYDCLPEACKTLNGLSNSVFNHMITGNCKNKTFFILA